MSGQKITLEQAYAMLRRREERTRNVIYVIDEGDDSGPIKIGTCTRNGVRDRLLGLQTGNPRKLRTVHVNTGDRALEFVTHFCLQEWRMCGEWFARAERVNRFVRTAVLHGYMAAIDDRMEELDPDLAAWIARRTLSNKAGKTINETGRTSVQTC
jgi:hypothetical protein